MDKRKTKELHNKIIDGLRLSYRRLLEEKKRTNGKLVISHNGEILILSAEELEQLQNGENPTPPETNR